MCIRDRQIPEAGQLGGREYRRDADLLPATQSPSQTPEEHEHARAAQRGDQAPNAGGAHLPEYRILSAADSGLVRGNPRNMAGRQPVSEHGVPRGTEKGVAETGRLKQPRAVVVAPGFALRATDSAPESANYLIILFAQLDAHNYPDANAARTTSCLLYTSRCV